MTTQRIGSPTKPGRTYETVARLDISADGTEAELSAQSPQPNANLILAGKGTGKVCVGNSPVLTVESLGDIDELAAVLAGITIEGADPAAVLALQAQVDAIIVELAALAAGSLAATPLDVAAVQLLIDATLAALPPGGVDEVAVKALISAALAALIMPILDDHTTEIAGLDTSLKSVQALVAALVDEIAAVAVYGGDLQALLDLLAVKPDATVADVEKIWRALSDTSVGFAQLLSIFSGKPLTENPSVADVQDNLPLLIKLIVEQILADLPGGVDNAEIVAIVQAVLADASPGLVQAVVDFLEESGAGEQLAQQLIDIIGGKPQGGGSIADVAATFAALGQALSGAIGIEEAAVNALIQAALADLEGVSTPEDILELIDAALAAASPGIVQAVVDFLEQTTIQDIYKALEDEAFARTDDDNKLEMAYQYLRTTKAEQSALQGLTNAVAGTTSATAAMAGGSMQTIRDNLGQIDNSISGVLDRITTLEGAALSGGDVSQAVVDSLLARLDALEAENVALKMRVLSTEQNVSYVMNEVQRLQEQDAEIVDYVVATYAEKDALQEVADFAQAIIDAMNGPDATVAGIQQMFWLLNDIIEKLMTATGVELP